MSEPDVVVVGSGPNGLAAGVTLARAGLQVRIYEAASEAGGGLRSLPLFDSQVAHDLCSAVHPMAAASKFFREFDLPARGVSLLPPEVAYAQPLDDGRAGLAYSDLARTCAELGVDGEPWRRLFAPLVEHSRQAVDMLFSDFRHIAANPSVRLLPTRVLALRTGQGRGGFSSPEARGLLAGVAAHAVTPLPSVVGAGTALLLGHLAHSTGWPIPQGGSQRIADALIEDLQRYGGVVHTDSPIRDLRDLDRAKAILLDLSPRGVLDLAGSLLPARYRRQLNRFRYGPGVFKMDFLVSEPIPWAHPGVGRAGTVHLGGTQDEVFRSENIVAMGDLSASPFVLLVDPAATDHARALPGKRPVWAYCHVPAGDATDLSAFVIAQIERFAPGFSDTILASRSMTAAMMADYNPNYVGGDISTGAIGVRQLVARPAVRWDPYRTPLPGVYLCSAATPPGPGVHGMSGYFAARSVLKHEFGMSTMPSLAPVS